MTVGQAGSHRRASDRALAAAGHLAVALVATAPLAWRTDHLPLGTEREATVPQFNLWTLEWTADRLPHGFAGWWNAPIFWPERGTFAFSEPQPLTGLAFAALRPALGAVAAYAAILIVTIALNGLGSAAVARRLGAGPVPAFLAGVLAQTIPFAFQQFGVLQLTALWPLLAATACLLAWLDEPRTRHAALLGLSLAAAVGTCGYYALLFVLGLVLAAPFAIDRTWRGAWRARLAGVAVAVAVLAVLAGPVALGQQRRLEGHRWLDATILEGSASWSDWAPGGPYWPGYPLVGLALAGVALGRGRPRTRLLGALAVGSLLASLGSRLVVAGLRPWSFLVDHVDAIARLRSPFRAAALVQLALVALAVPALERLWTHRSEWGRAAAVALVLGAMLTSGLGPGRLVDRPPPAGAWARWLDEHDDGAAVAFLPFAPSGRVEDFEATTTRMLQALPTGHAMVNGYSGFFPHDHRRLRQDLAAFPDERSLAALRARDVRYVVIDAVDFDRFDQRIAHRYGVTVVVHDADAYLLRIADRAG